MRWSAGAGWALSCAPAAPRAVLGWQSWSSGSCLTKCNVGIVHCSTRVNSCCPDFFSFKSFMNYFPNLEIGWGPEEKMLRGVGEFYFALPILWMKANSDFSKSSLEMRPELKEKDT